MDHSDILGRIVECTIDRPLGSIHPEHPDIYYSVNYGYVDGIYGGDGEEQDVYILRVDKAIKSYKGKVIAIYHRLNDNEDKWIVSSGTEEISDEEILNAIEFQEKYFEGQLIR
ncbi:MAG: inorganic pyrophosphatase [Clostridia bacterium]|nr:inorganic pyrophosphatase [Clostridia bacterium]NCC44322.1 inorganic pyrophosphatase [Clostridia bacterium]